MAKLIFLPAAAVALVLASPLALVPAAHAANEITFSMQGGVLYDSCGDYGYTYVANLPTGYAYSWTLELEFMGPDGNEVDSDFMWDEPITGSGDFFLCESPNLAGTYSIRGSGEACNSDYSCIPITAAPSAITFRLPQTRTTVAAKPRRPRNGQVVRFVVRSKDERPAGYYGTSYASVRLQARRGGAWRTIGKASTNDNGRAVLKARYTGRRVAIRAVTQGDSDRTGSTSRTIRVG